MPRAVDGTYETPSNSVAPAVASTTIDPDDFNTLITDMETAISETVYTSAGLGSTDNRLTRTDGTNGKKVQASAITVDDSGNLSGIGYVDIVETSAPASPEANTIRLYAVDTGGASKLAYKDSAGLVQSFGTAANFDVGTGVDDIVQLDGTGKLPAVDGSQLTNLPGGGGSTTAPTRQTFTSGSGTYTTPASVVWLRVRMVGGGGGGGGSGGSPGNGGTGGNTTFSTFTASGGLGNSALGGGTGGAASGGTMNIAGGRGCDANNSTAVGSGYGGGTPIGQGAPPAVYGGSTGRSGVANTGGGGSGATSSGSNPAAAGGGGGGYVEGYITTPAGTYSYAVGAAGTAGAAGSSGSAGGAGGSGYIIVEEFY